MGDRNIHRFYRHFFDADVSTKETLGGLLLGFDGCTLRGWRECVGRSTNTWIGDETRVPLVDALH